MAAHMGPEEQNLSPVLGPVAPRPYWLVLGSVIIRALHQVGVGVYLTSFLIKEIVGPPALYLWLSIATGLLLLVTEGIRHRALYREVAGLATLLKLVLLGIAYHGYLPQTATVLLAFVIAAIAAHLPRNLRHRLVF